MKYLISKKIPKQKIKINMKEGRYYLLSIVKSMSLIGLEGYLVSIEVDVSAGIPCWDIVRLTRYKC